MANYLTKKCLSALDILCDRRYIGDNLNSRKDRQEKKMSRIIKVNTDQGRYRQRRINYDRFAQMCPGDWDHEAVIGEAFVNGESTLTVGADPFCSHAKRFRVCAAHGGTVAASYGHPARTSAVLAIECAEDGVLVVMGAQISANRATQAKAAVACLAGVLDTGWVGAQDGRWLWDGRSTRRDGEAWGALVRAYEAIVARETAAA